MIYLLLLHMRAGIRKQYVIKGDLKTNVKGVSVLQKRIGHKYQLSNSEVGIEAIGDTYEDAEELFMKLFCRKINYLLDNMSMDFYKDKLNQLRKYLNRRKPF